MAARLTYPERNNLPAETTSFVGRRREMAAVKGLLRTSRLVTLLGVPGVGKTRLAQRLARDLTDRFRDGVWLIELSALGDGELVLQAVADVLRVQDQSSRPLREALSNYLGDKSLLLILDNCEHLLTAVAELADAVITRTPEVHILATSRAPLRVYGEHLFDVDALPYPTAGDAAGSSWRNGAPRLFADRATAASPSFTELGGKRAVIAAICERLDGIPLAVELAAARVGELPVEEVLTGLDDYFSLLRQRDAGPDELPALRAAIDWSFELCSKDEQAAWSRASVFAGGFDLPAAQAVCADDGITLRAVEDLVSDLIDKSVLVWADQEHAERYRMPEPLRRYGHELVTASGQEEAVCGRHRDYYAALVEAGDRDWLGPDEVESCRRLRRDHPNVRAALDYSLREPAGAQRALQMASTLWVDWVTSGSHREGRHWLDAALDNDPAPSRALADALWVDAWLTLQQGELGPGLARAEQARSLAAEVGDESALAHAIRIRGMAAFYASDLDAATTLLDDALQRHRAIDDRTGVWISLLELTITAATRGDTQSAVAFGEQCLALSDERARISRSWALWALALSRWLMGDTSRSLAAVREGLVPAPLWDNEWGIAHSLEISAWIAESQGEAEAATRLLGAAQVIWRAVGASPSTLRHLVASHELCRKRARDALGPERFAAGFTAGQRLGPAQAVALVPAEA